MRGYIQEREYESGNLAYTVFFDIPQHAQGNLEEDERPRVTETFQTEEEAEQRLSELNYKYHVQDHQAPSKKPFSEHLEEWLQSKEGEVKPSTVSNYRGLIRRHVVDHLGDHPLDQITPAILQQFLQKKKDEGLSGSYRHEMYVVLKGALDYATRMGKLNNSPIEPVKPPSQQSNKELTILDESQLEKLLNTVEKEEPWFKAFYHLVCNTGMRRGESLGLRWEDVDFQENSIMIQQQLTVKNELGLILDSVKTDKSQRKIHLFPPVMKQLKNYREEQEARREKIGDQVFFGHDRLEDVELAKQKFVFTERDGKPIRPGRMTKHIKKMCEKADLPGVHFHSLRHTHVSVLIKMGVDLKTISNRLGHRSVQFTLDTYGHLLPGQDRSAACKFGEALYGEKTEETDGKNIAMSTNVNGFGEKTA